MSELTDQGLQKESCQKRNSSIDSCRVWRSPKNFLVDPGIWILLYLKHRNTAMSFFSSSPWSFNAFKRTLKRGNYGCSLHIWFDLAFCPVRKQLTSIKLNSAVRIFIPSLRIFSVFKTAATMSMLYAVILWWLGLTALLRLRRHSRLKISMEKWDTVLVQVPFLHWNK